MKTAILSDIHANLAAFKAVLSDIDHQGGVAEIWCLGDIVDYGPEPHACIELLKKHCSVCVVGNHDYAAVGKMSLNDFNPEITSVTRWTADQLTREDKQYLESLPLTLEKGDFTLAHGSPRDPIWEYILTTVGAEENLRYFKTQYCLVGHSHVPLLFECSQYCLMTELTPQISPDHSYTWKNLEQAAIDNKPSGAVIKLGKQRLIINPGGVGQPRDNDPRAAYAIYDANAGIVTLHRVEYDIRSTQQRMEALNLPDWLIERLAHGR